MQSNDSNVSVDRSIDTLNSFLRGEISAVETYRQAIDRLVDNPLRYQLKDCLESHVGRVEALRQRVQELGGTPSTGSGVWGAFARMIEGSATMLGEKATIAALEEGEDHGKNDYQRDAGQLDYETRSWFESRILPEQQRTHDQLSALKKSLS
jgi:uncharacterized protein (TIGR02284 family)